MAGNWRRALGEGRLAMRLLLGLHLVLLVGTMRRSFLTVDEVMNVSAGLGYWEAARFHVYRTNPPLAKLVAALPIRLSGLPVRTEAIADDPTQRTEYRVGRAFAAANRDRLLPIIRLARLPGILWSLLAGWLIWRWTAELHGGEAALLALALWCVEPMVLGHAPLVTSDVPAAAAGLAAAYAFRRYLEAPSWRRVGVAGLTLGLAALTKFTLLVFFVLWPLLLGFRLRSGGDEPGRPRWLAACQCLFIAVIGVDVINAGYLGRGSGQALGDLPFVSRLLVGPSRPVPGNRFEGTWAGRLKVPLPEDFVRGIDVQRADFEGRRLSYLGGTWRRRGWWYFYLYALAVKLPLGTIALALWGLALVVPDRHRPGSFDRRLPALLALAILGFLSTQAGFTLHARYALPAVPYLLINAGRVLGRPSHLPLRKAATRGLAWSLVATTVASSLAIYPHSLSYFNEAAGGPLRGHRHLVDSNIDWGQDLLDLRDWARAHPEARPLRLAYYNFHLAPDLVGLPTTPPPPGPRYDGDGRLVNGDECGPLPGTYAVSVNFLHGVEYPIADGRGGFRATLPDEFAYFRHFTPQARAGYSLYIYRIDKNRADAVRHRLGLPPVAVPPPWHPGQRGTPRTPASAPAHSP